MLRYTSINKRGELTLVLASIVFFLILGTSLWLILSNPNLKSAPTNTPTPTTSQTTPSPTPDPYENWETYESEEYGVSFKYPIDYTILTDEKTSETGFEYILYLAHEKDLADRNKVNDYGDFRMTVRNTNTNDYIQALQSHNPVSATAWSNNAISRATLVEYEDVNHNLHQNQVIHRKKVIIDFNENQIITVDGAISTDSVNKDYFFSQLDLLLSTLELSRN